MVLAVRLHSYFYYYKGIDIAGAVAVRLLFVSDDTPLSSQQGSSTYSGYLKTEADLHSVVSEP